MRVQVAAARAQRVVLRVQRDGRRSRVEWLQVQRTVMQAHGRRSRPHKRNLHSQSFLLKAQPE